MRLVLTVTIAVTVEGIRNIKSVWSKTSESEFLPDGPCFRSRDLLIQEEECEHTLATESGLASCKCLILIWQAGITSSIDLEDAQVICKLNVKVLFVSFFPPPLFPYFCFSLL
jgi:hypothetical protein